MILEIDGSRRRAQQLRLLWRISIEPAATIHRWPTVKGHWATWVLLEDVYDEKTAAKRDTIPEPP